MAKRNYIDFDKEEVPIVFDIELSQESFTMGINYNQTSDFFTIDLWDSEGYVIVLGEKVILNRALFEDLVDKRLPGPILIPLDESEKETQVTYDNFGVTVFLFVDDISDDSDNPNSDDYENNNNQNGVENDG